MTRGKRTAKCTAMYGQMYYTIYGNMYVQKILLNNDSKFTKIITKEKPMKTLKIPPELHQDLRKTQAEYNLPTLSSTIRFLWLYHKEKQKHESK